MKIIKTEPHILCHHDWTKHRQRQSFVLHMQSGRRIYNIETLILLVTPCLLPRIRELRGIAMLSVDKFPHPRKQTKDNEFIPCSNNFCHILKRFHSLKILAIPFIWPKSSYKLSVIRSHRSGKLSERRSWSPLWRHQWRSFLFISHADDVKR